MHNSPLLLDNSLMPTTESKTKSMRFLTQEEASERSSFTEESTVVTGSRRQAVIAESSGYTPNTLQSMGSEQISADTVPIETEQYTSDSEGLDLKRIIETSKILRRRVLCRHRTSDSNSSSSSDGDGNDDSEGEGKDATSNVNPDGTDSREAGLAEGLPVSPPAARATLLQWCPRFLDESTSSATSTNAQLHKSIDANAADQGSGHGSHSEFYKSLLQTADHQYPFRRRSEKNLHPYTKLVWTNPDELSASKKTRRDASVLYEYQAAESSNIMTGDNSLPVNQDDSEDDEYIPGSPEVATEETQQAANTFESHTIDLPHTHHTATYGKMAARRRLGVPSSPWTSQNADKGHLDQIAAGELGQRRRLQQPQQQEQRRRWDWDDRKALPSVSSLLGLNSSDPSDPYTFRESDELYGSGPETSHSTAIRVRHLDTSCADKQQPKTTDSGAIRMSSPKVSDDILAAPTSQALEASMVDIDSVSDNSQLPRQKRRRLLSRRRVRTGHEDEDGGALSDLAADRLPTAKAKKLGGLSRRQIRGVLPFSFMRDLGRSRDKEIDEEVDRWRGAGHVKAARRPIMTSSPSDSAVGLASWSNRDSDGDVYIELPDSKSKQQQQQPAGSVAELFSDDVSPLGPHDNSVRQSGYQSGATHQSHFKFNFMDIYEWQYPPLAPPELRDRAPAFLRIAARECRRRGICVKSQHDDPLRKIISIQPRFKREAAEEDIAQGILMSWRLGVIDVRRVYFCDDTEESDSFDEQQLEGKYSDGELPQDPQLVASPDTRSQSPILVSDDEAVEDNTIHGYSATGRRGTGSNNSRKPAASRQSRTQKSTTRRSTFSGGRSVAIPRKHQTSLLHQPLPEQRTSGQTASLAARGLDEVMGEFAALESEDDDNIGDNAVSTHLPPLLLDRHMSNVTSKHARKQQFLNRFSRQSSVQAAWRRSSSNNSRHISTDRRRRRSSKFQSHVRVAGGRHVPAVPSNDSRAEFLFDEDYSATNRAASEKTRRHQTRLLTRMPDGAGPGQLRGARKLPLGHRSGRGLADAVADRIGRKRATATPTIPNSKARQQHLRPVPYKGAQRKTAPKRIKPGVQSKLMAHTIEVDTNNGDERNLSGKYADELHCLPSGTRFPNNAWISQGGIRQIRRLLLEAYRGPMNPAAESSKASSDNCSYQYGDILRIETVATPAEFGQAYSTLFILWFEQMLSDGPAAAAPPTDFNSVLRWIEFVQQFITTSSRSKSVLVQVGHRLIDCAQDALPRLKSLVDEPMCEPLLAAVVGLSYAVALLHLALVLARARNVATPTGPRAVGQEEDDVLSELWPNTRLASAIDMFVVLLARLLGAGVHEVCLDQLGSAEQLWLVLIHIFSSTVNQENTCDSYIEDQWPAAAVAEAVPIAGVWSAVLGVYMREPHSSRRPISSLWSAFAYFLRLAQFNIDGVAAPRPAVHLHAVLLQIAEAATERQFQECEKGDGYARLLRPSEEAAIHQTYFCVYRIATIHGMRISINSPLYMTLYRHLESIKFRSLSIEPPPSLPRFFTRYSGSIQRETSALDSCTVLWLKALDASVENWILQLQALIPNSKQHRRVLRDVRSVVSKMLPTRILTFTPLTDGAQLSTLANYYAIFLFFLHAIPSDVVRAVRLFTQFQALLRFKDSASQTARRVYFEAWSAAATIIGLHLRRELQRCMNVGDAVARLVKVDTSSLNSLLPSDVVDYHQALAMAIGGWAESLGIVLESLRPEADSSSDKRTQLWGLVDAALMYLHRVLNSSVLASDAPTVIMIVLEVLRSAPVLELLVLSDSASHIAHASVLGRILALIRIWQDIVIERQSTSKFRSTTGNRDAATASTDGEMPAAALAPAIPTTDSLDSQALLAMIDSNELLEAAVKVEELERQTTFAAANSAVLRIIHERYVSRVRLHIMSMFTTPSANSWHPELRDKQTRVLEATVGILAWMISACVDGGLRTWESFLDEHGRDSLHLIPNWHGRRLVMTLFSAAAIDVVRSKGQSTERLEVLVKDVWFASVCDLALAPHVHRLAAQLQWMDRHAITSDGTALAVFTAVPVDRSIVGMSGILRTSLGESEYQQDNFSDEPATQLANLYEQRAALAVGCIDSVLQAISQTLRSSASGAPSLGTQRHIFSSWVAQLLNTQRQIQQSSANATYALADTRGLVSTMAERVTLLVRDNCAELFLPPNLMLQPL
ncbi:hypothetical protein COEREDRAFT_85727 [Coemansia reversa NRRL 1564]|uniref:Mus7/MMS22 family-domain-containing protein n=1 Tax=Coemansia reversa (strain ATCC 12441 / NRRL 1564) TaxID=763665 RepID=A0A2G5BFQ9_COERN|nr:hypothetical protein COEREDRAFT_85727 [Coemansia reversa NRRL 1564]|eukprot:PIA17840.1 hypothetical protein COEREDRAFT_85727 [Coemansia reversa NRRL 1564]